MDAVAALAFGIVVVNALKDSGVKTKREQLKGTMIAGIIAAAGLAAVYISLGWIGQSCQEPQNLQMVRKS